MIYRRLHIPLTERSKKIIAEHVIMSRFKNNIDKVKNGTIID